MLSALSHAHDADLMLSILSDFSQKRKISKNPDLRDAHKIKNPTQCIRALFAKNEKAGYKKIQNSGNPKMATMPTIEDTRKHFDLMGVNPEPINWSLSPHIKKASTEFEFFSPSAMQISNVLRKAAKKKSAPGPDQLSYQNLLEIDPLGKGLAILFNHIICTNRPPKGWKCFKTIMIPKSGDLDGSKPGNWRPIALLNTTYKIFTACLESQLFCWLQREHILHPNQKGIRLFEGCMEHNIALQLVTEINKNNNSPTHFAFLDIANAFPSIPMEAVNGILDRHGVVSTSQTLIAELYRDCQTSVFFACDREGDTRSSLGQCGPFPIVLGVRQGCPLSMLLFNVAINVAMFAIETNRSTNPSEAFRIMAYADDLCLTNNDEDQLHADILKINQTVNWLQMKLKPAKCALGTIYPPRYRQKREHKPLLILNEEIPHLEKEQTYKYLGIHRGLTKKFNPLDLYEEIRASLHKVNRSGLLPWQALKAYKTFIHSKLIYKFRILNTATTYINGSLKTTKVYGTQRGLEFEIRKFIRSLSGLSRHSTKHILYAPKEAGGLGCTELIDEYFIQSLSQTLSLLNSPDELIKELVTQAIKMHLGTQDTMTAMQTLATTGKKLLQRSWLSKIARAVEFLHKQHDITCAFLVQNGNFELIIDNPYSARANFHHLNKNSLSSFLHKTIASSHLAKWIAQPMAGLCAKGATSIPEANINFFRGNNITLKEFSFIYSARANDLPTNSRLHKTSKHCRNCGAPEEKASHALCSCPAILHMTTKRHNAIALILVNYLKNHFSTCDGWEILHEKMTCFTTTIFIPDIQIYNTIRKTVIIIDAKSPFDTELGMTGNDLANKSKYQTLVSQAHNNYGSDWKIQLHTFVIGALGSWFEPNTTMLQANLHFDKKTISAIKMECAKTAISWSCKIWSQFTKNRNLGSILPLDPVPAFQSQTDTA